MFREGQYLEVIKASDNCLATAIITVKERIIEIEKKKVSTNKWLTLEDWSALYDIITKAILRNDETCHGHIDKIKNLERRKSTKRLDIIYKFEAGDESSLPTIKVRVCRAKKRSKTNEKISSRQNVENSAIDSPEIQVERLMEGKKSPYLDEYIPPELKNENKLKGNMEYVPSRKSLLKKIHKTKDLNSNDEYLLSSGSKLSNDDYSPYVPDSIKNINNKIKNSHCYKSASDISNDEYTPTLKKNKKRTSKIYKQSNEETIDQIKLNNEYTPKSMTQLSDNNLAYIPNSIPSLKKKIKNNDDNNCDINESVDKLSNDEYIPTSGVQSPDDNEPAYVPNLISNLSNKNDEYVPTTEVKWLKKGDEYSPTSALKKRKKNARVYEPSGLAVDLSNQNDDDEYIPTSKLTCLKKITEYSPNSRLKKKKSGDYVYEPCDLSADLSAEYVPSLKNSNLTIEEYEPDFATEESDFNLSYVPSSTKNQDNVIDQDKNQEYIPSKKKIRKAHEPKDQKRLSLSKKKNFINIEKREL